jgi:hypothetical protein
METKWGFVYIGIEDVQAQTLVVQTARKQGLVVRPLKANMDKGERAIPLQIYMEAGQVWFPSSHPELANLEHELLTFPQGAKDDTVDVLAYAGLQMQKYGAAAIPPEERARLERERLEREWQAKVERDKAAQADYEHPRWWQDAWSGDEHDD